MLGVSSFPILHYNYVLFRHMDPSIKQNVVAKEFWMPGISESLENPMDVGAKR